MNDILHSLLAVVYNLFTIWSILLIMQLFFGAGRCRYSFYGITGIIYCIFNVAIILIYPNELLQLLLIYVYLILFLLVLTKKNRFRTILYTIPGILFYSQQVMLLKLIWDLFSIPIPILKNVAVEYGYQMVYEILITAILFWILIQEEKKNLYAPLTISETVFITVFCLVFPEFEEVLKKLEETLQNGAYNFLWVMFAVILNTAVIYSIAHRRKIRYYMGLAENYKRQFDAEYAYFKDYKEKQQDTVKLRHDLNNHMLVLQSMFEQEDYKRAQAYFAKLSKKNILPARRILTGNEVVDMILSIRQPEMEKAGIQLHCKGGLEALSCMEDMDISILFSNLVDNAIEANKKYKNDRYITIEAEQNPGHLVIHMENASFQKIQETKDGLISTKEEEGHGIGTKNAFEIIQKYKGEYRLQSDEEKFSIHMLIPFS